MTTLSTLPPSGQTRRGAVVRPRKPQTQKRDWTGWKFVGPFMIVFALVLIAPVLYSIYLSFFKDQLVGGNSFVGFENYGQALTDPKFWESMGRVTLFFVVQVPIMLGIALFAALAIDSARLHLSSFFRIAIFLPYAVPAVVATLMWGFMYGTKFGLVGNLNEFFAIAIPNPLGSTWVLAAIGNIVTWEFIGYNMILFYAALRVIPTDLYEAASLDGAGAFRIIRSIKMPALRPAIVIGGIFSVIGSFQLFNEPSILQSLAPNTISTYFSPNMYAYNLSFSGQQYNYSATIAIIVGLITAVIAYIVQNSGSRKEA
ncbi:carbohydrate ABC transporter permease [Cryobacterium sp. W22_MBD10_FK3]|uniref:carbohydrate ABC transporter permease n=1 Tax=Cryobacterium sp. W22_MBD10_FK3 TaxID=3240273 RepID=UPI003F92ABCA